MIEANACIMHNGAAVQLLYLLIRKDEDIDIWMCKLLFVEEPNEPREINRHASYKKLHEKPRNWNYAIHRAGKSGS